MSPTREECLNNLVDYMLDVLYERCDAVDRVQNTVQTTEGPST